MFPSKHSLLTALVATTVLVTAALSWAGWRLLVQQGAIDEQRSVQQLESAAAGIVANIRGKLAEAGERLSGSLASPAALPAPIDAAILLTIGPDDVLVAGSRGLPFVPALAGSQAPGEVFAEGEALEFVRSELPGAAGRYEALAGHHDVRVRAGALLRLGRVLRKAGQFGAAMRAYQQLADLGAVRVGDLPAELAGLYGQRAALQAIGDRERDRSMTAQMVQGLDEGRWLLTRGVAEFYRDQLGANVPPASWPLADTLDRLWAESHGTLPSRGQRVFSGTGRSVLVMWRAGAAHTVLMAAFVDDFLPWPRTPDVEWRLSDPEGEWIAGERALLEPEVTRVIGEADYPWTLHVTAGAVSPADPRSSQRTLIAMMATMLLFLWGATYFMARAITREASVARLQSDFVAAVSHEFRSPLTTIRQMAEMLEMGRLATEERRQTYYRVLAGEATRLQRLVETLLNFGRMEAGAARYEFGDVDAATLVRAVVRDVETTARESGKRIEISGPDERVVMRADESALAVALRNLIDNAIKYSPDGRPVQVEWRRDNGHAAIRVIDRGVGIPHAERRIIFRKFVRGRSAIDTNVKGTGVGLSMVQQIVAAHGGEIRVESQVGRGSTFTMLLPVAN